MPTGLPRIICATGLLIGLDMMAAAVSGSVGAQPFERQPYEEWRYETKRPKRGYEDRRGREKCRIKSWTLVQFCS